MRGNRIKTQEFGDVVPLYSKTLGEIYEKQGHLEKAEVIYKKLVDENPGSTGLKEALARVRRKLGDLETGMKADPKGFEGDVVELLKELLERVRKGRKHGV